ncbi:MULTISPECIES: DUF6081 family protein [unclassified Mycobacterium]|uniref:DUF6081 family protein n=1 Tax=unclassified Mycobacterium TaxID=2642494 RepID=UPI0029C84B9D|nr:MULTISPECIES: DUF6081 family protein [unclassified Mycobacterium]
MTAEYDPFTGPGLDEQRWVQAQFLDPDGSLVVAQEDSAKTMVGAGTLEICVEKFENKNDFVPNFDNAKHLVVSTQSFPLPDGACTISVEMTAEILGGQDYSFRRGFAAFNVIDLSTGAIFDHLVTDRESRAVREQLSIPGVGESADPFQWLVECPITDTCDFTDFHEYAIVFNRSERRVTWLVDQALVFEAGDIDVPDSIQIGFGLMTLLPFQNGNSASLLGQGINARWRRLRTPPVGSQGKEL